MSRCAFCPSELTTGDVDGMCASCRNAGFGQVFNPTRVYGPAPGQFDPPPEYPPYTPPTQYGWMCPRCGAVHAPFIPHCHCTPPTKTTDSTQLNIDFDE